MRGIKDVKSKSKFLDMISERGYNSVEEFAKDCKLGTQSVFLHIRGQYKPSLTKMFIYANTLKVPVDSIIKLFYPKERKKNERY